MKNKKIQTLVAAMVITCMTTTSGLPVFAVPNDETAAETESVESEAVASESTDNSIDSASISKIIQNIQDCDSKIEYKMQKLNE